MKKIAFLFPGQGAQAVGMGRSFCEAFAEAREVFEEANDRLGKNLSRLCFEGPEEELTKTHQSQVALYTMSAALLRVVEKQFPDLKPTFTAGLSLGEYTALFAAKKIGFAEGLALVQKRGEYMSLACEATKGQMAVIMGLEGEKVEQMVKELNLPHDLWAANFNCPGQVVISGTEKGIAVGSEEAKRRGAKRVLPLQVHGAFHSGLMRPAEKELTPYIEAAPLVSTPVSLVMNVPGTVVKEEKEMRRYLIQQVTHPVRWEQGIRTLEQAGVDLYIEIGAGKTLAGMNKRIGVQAPTLSIETIDHLEVLHGTFA